MPVRRRKSRGKRNAVILVAIVGLVLLAFAVYSYSSGGTASSASQLAHLRVISSAAVLGSASAPVTIFEFGDPQCPSCDYWFKTQEQQIVQNLVDTGKARLVWKDFDYYGPDSTYASQALYAAGVQGEFWDYYNLIWTNQGSVNSGWASPDNLRGFAQQLGLNITEFNRDFGSGNYTSIINSNLSDGQALGVNGTPTFFLVGPGGRVMEIVGPQPYSVFQSDVRALVGG